MRRLGIRALRVGLAAACCLACPGRGAAWADGRDVQGRILAGGEPVANTVIWLDATGAPRPPQREKVVIDQRNQTFYPHVLAIRVGTTVDFPNDDRVFHNVFSYRDGRKFDLGMYPVGAMRQIKFSRPGLSRLFCNIHPKMAAYVMTVDTPYFAVSDRKGHFTLPDVPAGTHTYHIWRPGADARSGSLAIRPGEPVEVRWP
jgi:plastocyanin